MTDFCTICLQNNTDLKAITGNSDYDSKIVSHLHKCVPEVEWCDTISLCSQCLQQLEQVIAFRDLCISSYYSIKKRKIDSSCEAPLEADNLLEKLISTANGTTTEDVRLPEQNTLCHLCGITLSSTSLLTRHLKIVHTDEKTFTCDICDRKFASQFYLKAHRNYHSVERSHICSYCGKAFKTSSDLIHHEQIHSNKRAYKCEICPEKAFKTASDLYKHKICLHLDKALWKYQCKYCDKKFPHKSNLDGHVKIHTGVRNFACHLCNRKCISGSLLRKHLKSHTIDKKLDCNLCANSYKHQKSLNLHLARVHGVENIECSVKIENFISR